MHVFSEASGGPLWISRQEAHHGRHVWLLDVESRLLPETTIIIYEFKSIGVNGNLLCYDRDHSSVKVRLVFFPLPVCYTTISDSPKLSNPLQKRKQERKIFFSFLCLILPTLCLNLLRDEFWLSAAVVLTLETNLSTNLNPLWVPVWPALPSCLQLMPGEIAL